MSFDQAMQKTQQWGLTAEALGALAAHAAIVGSNRADAGVVERLRTVAAAAGLPDLGTLEPPQCAMLAALARSALKQALDLVEDPERAPGWVYTDPGVLDGWGRGSSAVPGMIASVAPEIGEVRSLLDVGTGVGLLAVGAANVWPEADIVGIDTWEPALERARMHVKEAELGDRVELRKQSAADLDDVARYDCVWVPTFFLTAEELAAAMPRFVRALKAGGWLVLGRFLPIPDPVAHAMLDLRTYRFGGHLLDETTSIELMTAAGATSVRVAAAPPPVAMSFTIGQKVE